jgi:type II secretory pathway pseudopilin PulG
VKGTSRNEGGFTLTEVVIAMLLLGLVIGGLLTSFVMGRISAFQARHHTQAMNLLQGKLEELLAGDYDDVKDEGPVQVTVDPGPDLEWGTADDRVGNLRVDVQDHLDLDGDGDATEEEIDLDGDSVNDPCKPVRVTLAWTCLSYGGDRSVTLSLDTLIARR